MSKFLWNGKEANDKIPLVVWDKVCKAKQVGGVGLRNWKLLNEAMGAKVIWKIYSQPNQKWVLILKHKYLDQMSRKRIFTINTLPKGSAIWNFIASYRHVITEHITLEIGNGTMAKFWTDSWERGGQLSQIDKIWRILYRSPKTSGEKR